MTDTDIYALLEWHRTHYGTESYDAIVRAFSDLTARVAKLEAIAYLRPVETPPLVSGTYVVSWGGPVELAFYLTDTKTWSQFDSEGFPYHVQPAFWAPPPLQR